jgi:predicted oxidoreductase
MRPDKEVTAYLGLAAALDEISVSGRRHGRGMKVFPYLQRVGTGGTACSGRGDSIERGRSGGGRHRGIGLPKY